MERVLQSEGWQRALNPGFSRLKGILDTSGGGVDIAMIAESADVGHRVVGLVSLKEQAGLSGQDVQSRAGRGRLRDDGSL